MPRAALAFAIAIALSPGPARATPQLPEKLVYQGKTLALLGEPLERYLSEGERPSAFKARIGACWRGYEGTWKIEEGCLWLAALHECSTGRSREIPLAAVFPGQRGPLRASWYTGLLRVPLGKRPGSRLGRDLLLAIRAGKLEGERIVEHDPEVPEQRGFREALSDPELAHGLMSASEGLARCARLGKQRGPVELEIQPDGTVGRIKLGASLPGTRVGKCLFAALAAAAYPPFYGPPQRTTHNLP